MIRLFYLLLALHGLKQESDISTRFHYPEPDPKSAQTSLICDPTGDSEVDRAPIVHVIPFVLQKCLLCSKSPFVYGVSELAL